MSLQLVTPPTQEPLTIADARAQCRIDLTDEDVLLLGYIQAARDQLETEMRRQFLTATYRYGCDTFGGHHCLRLPRPPLQSVTSVSYIDTAGATQTLATTVYGVDTLSEPGKIYLKEGQSWPSLREQPNAVQVVYVAGWPSPALVPAEIKQAMRLLIGHWYEQREATADKAPGEIPLGVERLLWNKRVVSFY